MAGNTHDRDNLVVLVQRSLRLAPGQHREREVEPGCDAPRLQVEGASEESLGILVSAGLEAAPADDLEQVRSLLVRRQKTQCSAGEESVEFGQ